MGQTIVEKTTRIFMGRAAAFVMSLSLKVVSQEDF